MRVQKINPIQQTANLVRKNNPQENVSFKGLWGCVIRSEHKGSELMYGGECTVDRWECIQEYFPFADETKSMTADALRAHAYEESSNKAVTNVVATSTTAKIMPKLKFTIQEFVDYVGNNLEKAFKIQEIEKNLQETRLTKYIRR